MADETMWDLVVIGGGSAGLVASKTAASFGARVLLIEKDRLGGDCLWTGCIPSKSLISAANKTSLSRGTGVDFAATMQVVHEAIQTIAPTDSREALEAEGVSVAQGTAQFLSSRTLALDGAETRFKQAIIATGTSPVAPHLAGSAGLHLLTSESFWDLRALPAELVILGGGAIGCELGQAMARLGSRVTIVQRGPRILPKEEASAARIIHEALLADGVTILAGRTAVAAASTDRFCGMITLDDGQLLPFDRLLAALGREPSTADLNLEAANITTTDAGFVRVDATLRTSNKRIWAAGDITGMPQFTHTAGVNGSVAATNAILGLRRQAETRVIPRVTFTSPEVAAVGLEASSADLRHQRVITRLHDHSDRAIAESNTAGYTEIVVGRRGRILGGTIVGPRAGETVGELALAVHAKLSTSALASTIHPYPTYNDPLWNAAVSDVRYRLGRGVIAGAITLLRRLRSIAMG
ncbi:MAG: FAD-dependent oxidoreductase [Salinibacterium sp.]|nr:FAD-dependent oxidoreductase [Salinibacterium sp.]